MSDQLSAPKRRITDRFPEMNANNRMDVHEAVCEQRHNTINKQLAELQEAVEPLPVIADNLRTMMRILWVVMSAITAAAASLIWQSAIHH